MSTEQPLDIRYVTQDIRTMSLEDRARLRTRDGRSVRIYTTDGSLSFPIHGAVFAGSGLWDVKSWTATGRILPGEPPISDDLVLPPKMIDIRFPAILTNEKISTAGWLIPSLREGEHSMGPHEKYLARIILDASAVPEGEGLDRSPCESFPVYKLVKVSE